MRLMQNENTADRRDFEIGWSCRSRSEQPSLMIEGYPADPAYGGNRH